MEDHLSPVNKVETQLTGPVTNSTSCIRVIGSNEALFNNELSPFANSKALRMKTIKMPPTAVICICSVSSQRSHLSLRRLLKEGTRGAVDCP